MVIFKKKRGLATRHARRIRRGIIGARLAHSAAEVYDIERASRIYYTVSSFGGITQRALFREHSRLIVG